MQTACQKMAGNGLVLPMVAQIINKLQNINKMTTKNETSKNDFNATIGNTVLAVVIYMKYPELVTKLTTLCSGWLVGSSANPNETEPRDYDIYIPVKYWLEASNYIPKDAKINRMGGFKCISDGIEVDVWTGDMNDFLASNYFNFAYQPKTGVRIGRL